MKNYFRSLFLFHLFYLMAMGRVRKLSNIILQKEMNWMFVLAIEQLKSMCYCYQTTMIYIRVGIACINTSMDGDLFIL